MKHDSSGEDRGGYSDDEMLDIDSNSVATLKTPLLTLAGHTGMYMYMYTYIISTSMHTCNVLV